MSNLVSAVSWEMPKVCLQWGYVYQYFCRIALRFEQLINFLTAYNSALGHPQERIQSSGPQGDPHGTIKGSWLITNYLHTTRAILWFPGIWLAARAGGFLRYLRPRAKSFFLKQGRGGADCRTWIKLSKSQKKILTKLKIENRLNCSADVFWRLKYHSIANGQ